MLKTLGQELRRLGRTARWSAQGLGRAWADEKSFRQWIAVNAVSVLLALILDLTAAERALIVALGLLILVAELLNTAIEATVDYISPAQDPRARKAKDCGSAAVALTAVAGAVAWMFVLWG